MVTRASALSRVCDFIADNENNDVKAIPRYLTPDPRLIYCKAALEAKFPDKKFTLEEVKTLIREEYGQDL